MAAAAIHPTSILPSKRAEVILDLDIDFSHQRNPKIHLDFTLSLGFLSSRNPYFSGIHKVGKFY
jgi:hypothetical protein